MTAKVIFDSQVIPIMDKVRTDLNAKQAKEYQRESLSFHSLMSSAVGPDGGMAARSMMDYKIRTMGEWNSKTVEDYVEMVKKELHSHKIEVTPEIEQMMIDKMIQDNVPKSSAEYVIRKAAQTTIFGLPEQVLKSPMQNDIEHRAEELYQPSALEKGLGVGLGAATDFVALGGSSLLGGLKFVGADLALNAGFDCIEKTEAKTQLDIPKVIAPGQEDAYLADDAIRKLAQRSSGQVEQHTLSSTYSEQSTQTQQSNSQGWTGVLSNIGFDGIGDIGRNFGYIIAMLPDILLGIFTGKTKSLGFKDNLMPIASIIAGMFVKNPLLKMTLIGVGGANLLNKAGREQLDKHNGIEYTPKSNYRTYPEELLNPRLEEPQIKGNVMVVSIDKIPITVTLPDKVVDAYNSGALPLSTLANAILTKADQMQQLTSAQERYESETRGTTQTLSQR